MSRNKEYFAHPHRLLVTVREAAFMLHVGVENEWFKERMRLGDLKGFRILGTVYISRKSIEELIENNVEAIPVKVEKFSLNKLVHKKINELKYETLHKQRTA